MRLSQPVMLCLLLVASGLPIGCADPLAVPGPPPPATCGNDRIEWPEVCDGADLQGQSCRSIGFAGGFLACTPGCAAFDDDACVEAACGNDRIEGIEFCDGFDLDGNTCVGLGFDEGTLRCRDDCMALATGDCSIASCGNGLHEPPELCDGAQLNGQTCQSLGFAGGSLSCLTTCGDFDTGACEEVGCGNGRIETGELCDGADLGGRSCTSLGYAGGLLRCAPTCDEFDTDGCDGWPTCGNGTIDTNEVCDGAHLGGMTCEHLGYIGGTLACRADCLDWDVHSCIGGSEVCFNLDDDDADGLIDCEDPTACQYISHSCTSGSEPPGGPCWAHNDCLADDSDPFCFDEVQTGSAGGYCAEFCDSAIGSCVGGGVCVASLMPSGNGLCMAPCAGPGDCRPGQRCIDVNFTRVCLPSCDADDQCISYPFCNSDTGQCGPEDENCRDGIDNDDDGNVDCGDLDCASDPTCGGACVPDDDLGSAVGPAVATGDTSWGVRNRYQPMCVTSSAPESLLSWTAPTRGRWSFDLVGTGFDAVLSVGLADCGPVLACAPDSELPGNPVTLDLGAGERITLIIDGEVTDAGPWVLNISSSEAGQCSDNLDNDGDGLTDCADPDCGPEPACGGSGCPDHVLPPVIGTPVFSGTTLGAGNDVTPVCGFSDAPDVQVEWLAPFAGRFVFDTFGSNYDTLLHVLSGCGGVSLGCNDDTSGLQSQVTLDLVTGQSVVIVIDGWADNGGNFILNISTDAMSEDCADGIDNDGDGAVDCIDPDCVGDPICATCPELFVGTALGTPLLTGSTAGSDDQLAPTCASPGSPEARIEWMAPWPGRYVFDTVGSNYDTVLYLLAGGCTGPEIACNDDADGGRSGSEVSIDLLGGESLVVVVDGWGGQVGDYVLSVRAVETGFCDDGIDNDNDGATDCDDSECAQLPECLPTGCPDQDLGSALGLSIASGSTQDWEDELQPWCAVSTAPDVQYRWTAPADGRFVFDTFGSAYDTILYALNDVCGGGRLQCNDDAQGLQSRIRLNLRAGEVIILVVDGFGSAAGDYVLNAAQR